MQLENGSANALPSNKVKRERSRFTNHRGCDMRFVRENGKFYVDDPDLRIMFGGRKKELTFRELTLAMADIANLIETHVTVTEDNEKYGPPKWTDDLHKIVKGLDF